MTRMKVMVAAAALAVALGVTGYVADVKPTPGCCITLDFKVWRPR